MMAGRYGAIGRGVGHIVFWLVLLAIGMSALGAITFWLKYLSGVFVGQGILFALFLVISFGVIGVVGGLVHFILDKALEWFKNRKG